MNSSTLRIGFVYTNGKIMQHFRISFFMKRLVIRNQMILRFLLVTDLGGSMLKSRLACSGSKIEIPIMKTVRDYQCEQLLIYNHDDLTNLDIEINFLKVCVFCCFFSLKFLNKLCIKNALKSLKQKIKKSFKN